MADQSNVEQELERRAMASQAQPRKGYGQVVDKRFKLVVWDAAQRAFVEANPNDTSGQIEISIIVKTFKRDGTTFDAERKQIDSAFGTNNWRDITLKSLKELGTSVSDLLGKWVEFEFRNTKRYNKETRRAEETTFDTFYFTKIFQSREDCERAFGESLQASVSADNSADDDSSSVQPTVNNDAVEKAAVTLFNMIKAGNPDNFEEKFKTEVARNKPMMDHFKTADKALEFVNTPF